MTSEHARFRGCCPVEGEIAETGRRLRDMLSDDIAVVEAWDPTGDRSLLWPEEEEDAVDRAVDRRRQEANC